MFDEQLAQFSRERLGGRPVPTDVRILATAQWDGSGHPFERFGITVLEPGTAHPLTDTGYLGEEERADPDMMAVCAASEQMAQYLMAVAQAEDGEFYGYWWHPQQASAQEPPPVVKVDTEFSYEVLPGRTFAEACLADLAFDDAELFAQVAAELAELHIAVPVGSREELEVRSAVPDPGGLHTQLYYAERERLGLPA
ncbi:hypothetical protein ACFW1A_18560 [Kitasatospora sp. NPDC058965]|uniref:hypothetical protein n=1 Tax=Kitasatospora sp. NPDC058965 TaxID=3346682 RepID=UPI0036850B3C